MEHYAETVSAIYISVESAGTPLRQIEKLFENMVTDAVEDPARRGCFVVNALLEIAPEKPKTKEVLRNHVALSEAWLAERVNAAVAEG